MTEGAQLHDRATRGESLTTEERTRLERWYKEQDEAEAALLAQHRSETHSDAVPNDLQATLARIREAAESIESLHKQNVTLRQEIVALQQRLAAKAA